MTKVKIKIEAIHDVVCSWCPIGHSNLKSALKRLENEVEAHITYLPFELNPDMSEEGETIANYFKRRQRWSSATLKDYQESLVKKAQSAGIVIDFSKRTHYYNTRKAHKLIHWVEQFNKQTAGSSHASNVFTNPGNIIWLRGKEQLIRYDDPDRDFTKVFCSKCGSGLPFVNKSGIYLVVPAGTLKQAPSIRPQLNIFCFEQASWYKDGISAKSVKSF